MVDLGERRREGKIEKLKEKETCRRRREREEGDRMYLTRCSSSIGVDAQLVENMYLKCLNTSHPNKSLL